MRQTNAGRELREKRLAGEFHALPEPLLSEVVSKRDAYERVVRGILRDGTKAGLFASTDIKLTALSFLGALNWTVVWWKPEGRRTPEAVADKIADTFLNGLLQQQLGSSSE